MATSDYTAGARGPISSISTGYRAFAGLAVITIGVTGAGKPTVRDVTFVQPDTQPRSNLVLDAATVAHVTRTMTASQYEASRGGLTDAKWRAALIAAWQREMARDPSQSQWWGQEGESNHGSQCAFAQAVVIANTENALGVHWVSNPRVPSAYHESNPSLIWRVDGDGSWKQWADQNPVNGQSRYHPVGDGYQPSSGDLAVYGDPGYHVVMLGHSGTVFGADDSSDLGNHHRPAGGGISGYIDMSLPSSLASSGSQATPGGSGGQHGRNAQPAQAAPAQPAAPQQADQPAVAGGLAAPGLSAGNGGSTLSSSATPVTAAVVAGGIAAPTFAPANSVGHADQFHADQPSQPAKQAANPARPRYSRHNPPATVHASVPGSAAQQAFIRSVVPGAQAAQVRYGVPAAVTVAQAINESGWGQSVLAARDHNLFGIKGSGPAGSDNLPTQEHQNGAWVWVVAPFRVYHSVAESIADHGALMHNGYYNAALASWRDHHDANAFANHLTGVYATSPSYGRDLIAIMRHFNLYQFNHLTASSGQSATSAAPAPHDANPHTVQGANLGNTGAQDQGNNPAPGSVEVPGMLPEGSNPVPAGPGQAAVPGGLATAGFGGTPTLSDQVTGAGSDGIVLTADVTPVPPWQEGDLPWNQAGAPAPPVPLPWSNAAVAAPVTNGSRYLPRNTPMPWNSHGAAPPVPAHPAELVAYHRPVTAPGTVTSLQLVDFTPLHPKHGSAFIRGFKSEVADNRAEYQQVSAETGVPWQIVGALALVRRAQGDEMFTLRQLVQVFTMRAMSAGVDVTTGRLSPAQLDAAFRAYTQGAKIKENGLTHSQVAQLIRVPPGTKLT